MKFYASIVVFLLFVVDVVKLNDELVPARVPIRLTQAPRSQVAMRGARVTFRCDYEVDGFTTTSTTTTSSDDASSSRVTIKWLFEEASATTTTLPKMRHLTDIDQFEFDTNALHILAYEPRMHSGFYRCLVNSTVTSPSLALLSPPANLSLARMLLFFSHSLSTKEQKYANVFADRLITYVLIAHKRFS